MARPSTLVYAASVLQAAPILTGILARTGLAGPRRWVVLWSLIGLASDAVQIALRRSGNSLWVLYLVAPLMGVTALLAMARWQRTDLARVAVWLMIPLSLAAWLAVLLTIEDLERFSLVVGPMYDLLCLGVAVYTMGTRGLQEDAPLLRRDWFWICGGLALRSGAAAAISPLGAALVASRQDIVLRALTLQAVTDIVAYLLIATGFLCRPLTHSGAFSSLSPSVWRSWWSPSERPS